MINKSYRHEERIYQYGIITAAIIGVAASVGTTIYQQKKAEEAQDKLDEAARLKEEQAKEIRKNKRPDQEAAKVSFGDKSGELGDYSDFLIPLADTSSETSGLGSSGKTTTLGFE